MGEGMTLDRLKELAKFCDDKADEYEDGYNSDKVDIYIDLYTLVTNAIRDKNIADEKAER